MYDRKAFKREAKQRMRESVPHFMLVALVYYLLTWGLSTAISWLTGSGLGSGIVSLFLNILIWLFGIVMAVGLSNYALRLIRREPTGWNSLFAPFNYAGRAIGLPLMVALYIFLWSLLVSVGFGVLAGLLAVVLTTAESVASLVICIALLVAAYIVLIAVIIMIALRYAMAEFVLVENPGVGVMESIRRSIRMMRGHKGKLFVLELSFIGWALLIALISAVVVAVGFAISIYPILESLASLFNAGITDPLELLDLYEHATNLVVNRLEPWILLAQVLSLPLSMWLLIYQQTTVARFYNFVSGYDYHQYMSTQQPPAGPIPGPAPIQPTQEPKRPAPPVESYYTPQPDLSETPPSAQPETPAPEAPAEPEVPVELPAEAPEEESVPEETEDASDEEEI